MLNFLRTLLMPPIFPDDEDKTRAARHTHFTALFIIGFAILYEVWVKLYTGKPINSFDLIVIGTLVLLLILLALLKSGMVKISSVLLVTMLWMATNILPAFGYGIHDSTFLANFVVVTIATLLLGWQASLVFGVLSALSAFGLVYLEQHGFLAPLPAYPSTILAQDITIMILLSAVSLYFLSSSLLTSLRKTRIVLNELSDKNKEMDRIQTSLQANSLRLDELNRINVGRATQLRTIIQIVHDIAPVRVIDDLLSLTANLVRERFGYYHVGIYLIDESGEYVILRAASGIAARTMLEQRHKFKLDEPGIVGSVASSGVARIAHDAGIDSAYIRDALLPESRSEAGLPLRSHGRVIGVLDIHADEITAFNQENIEIHQLLTDQLVAAVENVELVQRLETTLAELNTIYQAQTKQTWQKSIRERGDISLEYDGLQVKPVTYQLPSNIIQQLKTGKSVVLEQNHHGRAEWKKHGQNTLVIPLMVLNQMIGAIGLQQENPKHVWTEEEIALAEAVANRAALALENARLLEEAQRRAVKEQTIGEISAKIGNLVNIENIVQTTIQELSQMIPGTEVAIQFQKN
jgi:GAF domain-containing protein